MAIHGSCLCRGVEYELDGPVNRMVNCHCSICRKASGAAHATIAFADATDFRWLKGEDLIGRYETPANGSLSFCTKCSARLPGIKGDNVSIPAGTLDNDPGIRPEFHVFTGSKASWHEINDDLPSFEELPQAEQLAKLTGR